MDDEPKQIIFADRKLGVHTVDILPGQLAMLEGRHCGGIGLDLMLALLAPRNEPGTCGEAVAEPQRW